MPYSRARRPAYWITDGEVLVGGATGEAGGDGAEGRGFVGDRRGGGVQQDAVERGQGAEHAQEAGELDGGAAADGALVEGELDLGWRSGGEDVRDRGPGARGGEGFFGRLEAVQQVGAPAQEGDDLRPQIGLAHRPARPVVEIGLEAEVDETVGQRAGHARGDGAVAFAVAGGEDGPAVGQAVFTEGAVEHQLVAGGLDQRRGGVEFVEEEDAGAIVGQEGRGGPGGLAVRDGGQAAQIDRVEQDGADVDQAHGQRCRDLRHHLGFADAGGAPEEGGFLDLRQHLQRGYDFGRFHAGLHDGPPRSLSPRLVALHGLRFALFLSPLLRRPMAGRGGGPPPMGLVVATAAKPPIAVLASRDGPDHGGEMAARLARAAEEAEG